ncbi:MAG: hypothetical protein WCO92_03630 [Verrucomicrobiota bacterium]
MNFRKFMRWSFFLWQGDRVQRYADITPVRATQREEKAYMRRVAAAGSTAEGSPEGPSLAGARELQQAEIPKIHS